MSVANGDLPARAACDQPPPAALELQYARPSVHRDGEELSAVGVILFVLWMVVPCVLLIVGAVFAIWH